MSTKSLNVLRQSFEDTVDALLTQALTVNVLASFGTLQTTQHGQKYPDAFQTFGAGPAENPTRLSSKCIKVRDLAPIYNNNRGIVMELFHGRIVRAWYDHLLRLYRSIVQEYFEGKRQQVPTVPLQGRSLILDRNAEPDPEESLKSAVIGSYAFARTDEQMDIIQKALGHRLEEQLIRTIKMHTTVRNCFEHSDGVIRANDLKRLGQREIQLTNEDTTTARFVVGDRLKVSSWDIEDITIALTIASRVLVPLPP